MKKSIENNNNLKNLDSHQTIRFLFFETSLNIFLRYNMAFLDEKSYFPVRGSETMTDRRIIIHICM